MEVKLIYWTGMGLGEDFAARLLAFTKATRLQMTPDGFSNILHKAPEEIAEEMAYMATSIPSSWEFVDVIVAINGISRATAQQITRTRHGTFAMQSQRVTDMRDISWDAHSGSNSSYSIDEVKYDSLMREAISGYGVAVDHGVPLEDARDLLPIGVHCNVVAKYNLRTIADLVRNREWSLRVQGPYREFVKLLRENVETVWPWSTPFFADPNAKAREMLAEVARDLATQKGAMASGASGKIAKALDLLSKGGA